MSKIYNSTIKSSTTSFIFYADDVLEIQGEIIWKNNKLNKLKLTPSKTTDAKTNYEIFHINRCKNRNKTSFYMVHFFKSTEANDGNTFIATKKTHLRGIKINSDSDSVVFRFNMHGDRKIPDNKCQFNTDEPETKDGSIIVNIE